MEGGVEIFTNDSVTRSSYEWKIIMANDVCLKQNSYVFIEGK